MSNEFIRFPEDVYEFKNAIGIKAKPVGDELVFGACPYCRGGKNHDKDTFSINIKTGQFECKRSSCGAKGNLITLAKDFDQFHLNRDAAVFHGTEKKEFKHFAEKHIETRDPAVKYLAGRGISEAIVRKYEITTKPDRDNVLCFPFRDQNGVLTYIKYRDTEHTKESKGPKEWSEAGCKPILFGMNQCTDFGTLVITEGQIDALSVAEAGVPNAVSVPNGKTAMTWRPHVWTWLTKFEEIVVFGDNEGGHITVADMITGMFPKKVRVVRPADYRGCKDANEILQKYGKGAIKAAVDNAEAKVSDRIRSLADVEATDLEGREKFPTHFSIIDEKIGGGFHRGEVIILTGKCGEGKSTFASQLVGRMMQNGLKCFCYSGELPDDVFRAWLDIQLSGRKKPTEGKRNSLAEWYRDKCYIYDNSAVIDENEELFNVMTSAVRDLGCSFILIDNLMVAMEDHNNEDLFRQQSAFLKRLTKFAKGFNVIILLVAHPKKGDSTSNDSISGSGDITNRADIVLRYQRDKNDIEMSDVMITKNRTTGILAMDKQSIKVNYDRDTRRITAAGEKFDEFLPDSTDNGFESAEEEDIPF